MSIATVPTPSRWFQYESITSQPYVDYGIIVAINNDNTVNVDIQGYDLSATNKIILERVKYPAGYTPKYGDLVAIQWDGNVPIIARTLVSGEGIDIADLLMFYNDFNIVNSDKWNQTYWDTIKYRSTGAPTNNPVPTGIEIQSNPNATINIKLTWDTYTQGEKQADFLYLFWKKGPSPLGSPTVLDSCIAFNVNTTSPSYYIFEGVNPADNYSFGIAAARRTENGIEIGPIQSPTANPDWQDVTGGTPNYTANINGTAASIVATAVSNFNARNDRISIIPANPTIATDGTAIDHVINTDGSANISFEWQFTGTGDAYDIDGFIVYVYSSDSSSPYTFGTSPNLEKNYPVPPEKRAHILYGVPANKYYTFGIQAYRIVDQDINPNGILKSNIVKPSLSSENPYRPSNEVAFSGDVIGTIGGTPYDQVNKSPTTVIVADGSTTKNPKQADYVVPAGSTSAQTVINQAINSLGSGGGKIVLLDGTYVVDGSIVLPSNVALSGQGLSTVIKIKDNIGTLIKVIQNSDQTNGNVNIEIANFCILGASSKGAMSEGTQGILFNRLSYSKIESVVVRDIRNDGIVIYNSNDLLISGITSKNNGYGYYSDGGDGIHIESCERIIVSNSLFRDNTWRGIHIKQAASKNNTVVGNICSMNGLAGICVEGDYNNINNNVVTDNGYIDSGGWEGAVTIGRGLGGQGTGSYNVLNNNIIRHNHYHGIDLRYAYHIIITDNLIEDNEYDGNSGDGIQVMNSDYNTIQGNIIRRNTESSYGHAYGVDISSGIGNVLTNNDLYNSGISGSYRDQGTSTVLTAGNRL